MTENKGENKLDELLKERYELAKGRLSEICTEAKTAAFMKNFFRKITDNAMEILHMQPGNLENTGKPFLFFIQN